MKNIFKFRFYLLVFFFISLVLNASEKDKICPFELISFISIETRDSINNTLIVNLEWKTASEMNTDKFVVERNIDTLIFLFGEFYPIGELVAAGNSTEIKTYNFYDTIGFGTFTYRIKGVDKDGSYSYTNEIIIDRYTDVDDEIRQNDGTIISNIYPNPASGKLTVELNPLISEGLVIQLFDIKGLQVIPKSNEQLNFTNQLIDIDLDTVTSDEYILLIKTDSIVEFRKIAIVK